MKNRILCAALLAMGITTRASFAEERYYVTLFASQGEPNLPRLAHTFAVFTKATGADNFPKDAKIENHTISWLPATMEIHPLRLAPEKGKNFDLAATLQWAKSLKARVVVWGPFETNEELFDLAKQRIADLNEGKWSFIALDNRFRGQGAVNCIHAVSDINPNVAPLNTGLVFGEAASRMVVQHFQPYLKQPAATHPWLIEHLGVSRDEMRWESLTTK